MNINIEPFYCLIKKEHLFAYESNFEEYESVFVFAARSVASRALLFHCMTESGMQRANVPISALVHKTDAPKIDLDYLQLWNCFGNEMNVCKFDYLVNSRCQVAMKDKSRHWATYMMTFDWENNNFSLAPNEVSPNKNYYHSLDTQRYCHAYSRFSYAFCDSPMRI